MFTCNYACAWLRVNVGGFLSLLLPIFLSWRLLSATPSVGPWTQLGESA